MDLYNKFISNQNKGLVWKLLLDDGAFNSIPENKFAQVKDAFERKFETVAKHITAADTIVNLDKHIISEMINDLSNYTTKHEKKEEMTLDYSAADLAQKRQKIFENELITKKKDFDTYNAVPAPNKIDFSDVLDSPMGSEMDKILAEQIALREKQLNVVLKTQDKEAATKWIQHPGEGKIKTEEPVKLKIGDNIDINAPVPVSAPAHVPAHVHAPVQVKMKKVNFSDTIENDNFLALLKKKETVVDEENASIMTLLREILIKQTQILELFKLKN
jgi:hypothetical protein